MKKLFVKTVEFLTGAKVHATHTEIKGKKSGGTRDTNGTDWHKRDGSTWNYN
jgi:hypothetical protein